MKKRLKEADVPLSSMLAIAIVCGIIVGIMGSIVAKQIKLNEQCVFVNKQIREEYKTLSNYTVELEQRLEEQQSKAVVGQQSLKSANMKEIEVCSTSASKTYMDYEKITAKSSKQYKYIEAYMEVNEQGLLVDEDGYIGVALGSYFGDIGTKYQITLSTGIVLDVVKVEAKSDRHTNNGCEQMYDKSVIEFVIDESIAEDYFGRSKNGYILNGNFNNNKMFKGNIVAIKEVQ